MAPVTVSQLNTYVRKILNTDPVLSNVSVAGEVSNLSRPNENRHIYFSLKDEKSAVRCFLPSWTAPYITCDLSNGMEIIVNGSVDVYVRGGIYSLTVKSIDVRGEGELAAKFEKLKKRLYNEGLFEESHKKRLPDFPEKIAVITSEAGAAVRDITDTITKKNNYVDIMIFPVAVQGKGSAEQIANAIYTVNREFKDTDVIIVGRGGGSMEDLWAFNEEIVAYAVYDSEIPVISGVGHEIDTTIIDYVADVSEKTPTAAAARAVPDIRELEESLEQTKALLDIYAARCADLKEKWLESFNMEALMNRLRERTEKYEAECRNIAGSMSRNFERNIEAGREDILKQLTRLRVIDSIIAGSEKRADVLHEKLLNLDPHKIISRGYGALIGGDGRMITGVEKLNVDDKIRIVMSDGDADATVENIRRNENG